MQQLSKVKRYHYDAEVRTLIAKNACQYGNRSASRRFTQEFGHCVSESSVRDAENANINGRQYVTFDNMLTIMDANIMGFTV